ncbi:hypothetical protein VL06_18885 [Rossellomorea marisflavi]|nr:hypothetical protein VL03_12105 [Rossellomorea marisflavi]KML01447.1 hypothetical protein VL06_18885 [Rossellomorea marisflavi]
MGFRVQRQKNKGREKERKGLPPLSAWILDCFKYLAVSQFFHTFIKSDFAKGRNGIIVDEALCGKKQEQMYDHQFKEYSFDGFHSITFSI